MFVKLFRWLRPISDSVMDDDWHHRTCGRPIVHSETELEADVRPCGQGASFVVAMTNDVYLPMCVDCACELLKLQEAEWHK